MKNFSLMLVNALLGMLIVTHAYADTTTLTAEQIDRMYIDEVKVVGKTLQCFQSGQEIIHEPGLQNVEEIDRRISAVRLDGSEFEVILSEDLACTFITRLSKPQ